MPGHADFAAVQWWGVQGGWHGLAPQPAKPGQRGKNIHGQYYEAFPLYVDKSVDIELSAGATLKLADGSTTLEATPEITTDHGAAKRLDDLVVGGQYDLERKATVYTVVIDGEGQGGQADTFAWGVGELFDKRVQRVPISGEWQDLIHGVQIRFEKRSGHNRGSLWFISYDGREAYGIRIGHGLQQDYIENVRVTGQGTIDLNAPNNVLPSGLVKDINACVLIRPSLSSRRPNRRQTMKPGLLLFIKRVCSFLSHRAAILTALVYSSWCCVLSDRAVADAAASRPDIVIFLTDDHGQLDSTPYGGSGLRTPNIQRLADAGMTFTRAYVASPSCAPSRAALLTGLMPARNGAEANHSKPRPEIRKWPAYFQQIGYEVVAFGKVSHYRHTVDYGFDHFAKDTFHDHAGIAAAVEFLKNRKRSNAKPLCLFVGSNWPHVPWPEKELGYDPDQLSLPSGSIDTPETRAWRARYAAAVTKGDDELGRILDAAREYLPQQTLFLFSADHGAQWPFGKWNLYESGVCVPLIVAWPSVIQPRTRTAAMVNWTDFLPTLLEAAGGQIPADIDGRSFVKVLRGESDSHRQLIFTTHANDNRMNVYPSRAVRDKRWKYIRNLHPEYAFTTHIDLVAGNLGQRAFFSTWEAAAKTDPNAAAILKRYHARPADELYDLTVDPHEQHNLAADPQHAQTLSALRTELDRWMQEQGDRQPVLAEPRLLSDPMSYGPQAEVTGAATKSAKKKAARQ